MQCKHSAILYRIDKKARLAASNNVQCKHSAILYRIDKKARLAASNNVQCRRSALIPEIDYKWDIDMDKGNIINKSGSFRYICLFLMSFSAIFFQVSLIRSLSNIYYGTLTYFIISMALLGFGASGTVLFLLKKKLQDYSGNIILLLLLYLISIPFSLFFSNKIPLNLLYIFYDPRQILFLFTYSLLLFLPFFFCGMIIGLTLINEKNKEYFYGINLLGSGIGGITALIAMYYVDPLILVKLGFYPVAAAFLVSLVKFRISSKKYFLLFFLIPSGLFLIFSLPGNPDQYKDIYQYKKQS